MSKALMWGSFRNRKKITTNKLTTRNRKLRLRTLKKSGKEREGEREVEFDQRNCNASNLTLRDEVKDKKKKIER